MNPNTPGRPPLLTPQLHAAIVRLVGLLGVSVEDAAEDSGISRSTLFDWLERGRRERSGLYHDLVIGVLQARARRKIGFAAIVVKGTEDDPRLALSYMKYAFPDRPRSRRKKSKSTANPTEKAAQIRAALEAMETSAPGPAGTGLSEGNHGVAE